MKPSDYAWITLGAGVIGYDVACPEGETLSEGADRYMLHHRWLVRGVSVALAAHVCNLVPDRYDIVHLMFVGMRRARRGTKPTHLGAARVPR